MNLKTFFSSLKEPNSRRDWLLSLVILFVVFLGFLCYASVLFFSIQSGSAFSATPTPTEAIPVTRGEVETLFATYENRQLNYTAHNLPAPTIIDPGLSH